MLEGNEFVANIEDAPADGDIFGSVEMSRAKWVVGVHTRLAKKIALHTMACGDVAALLALIDGARAKQMAAGIGEPAVVVCYEAGYEGFWLYRRLTPLGVRVVVINPASLLVDRRAKRAKTDRIDARAMVRAVMAPQAHGGCNRTNAAHHGGGARPQAVDRPVALRDDGCGSARRHRDLNGVGERFEFLRGSRPLGMPGGCVTELSLG